jgi:hypothetical protein
MIFLTGPETSKAAEPREIIEKMVEAMGGRQRLHELQNVEYTYTYHVLSENKKDVSLERYVFDGELSWAKYSTREMYAFPDMSGEIVQGFDGKKSWMLRDGVAIHNSDPQIYKLADFTRKTNYYWFTMMFKLLDPGIIYESQGTKKIGENDYDVVRISFDAGVGDAQDTYLLYVNKETHLVDHFLFTVMDFGMAEPFWTDVSYEEIDGVKIPTKRRYVAAGWDGNARDDNWVEATCTNIKFKNDFDRSLFSEP